MKTYKVNEIFLSIQTEGANAGRPAVFVRFSGCNYRCRWCDTKHERGRMMTAAQIDGRIDGLTKCDTSIFVIFTGGEPTLQLESWEQIAGEYYTCVETNGSNPVPSWVDWITWSPKHAGSQFATHGARPPNEIKMVFQKRLAKQILSIRGEWPAILSYRERDAPPFYLQPCERKGMMNARETIAFIKKYAGFRLSVQTHKLLGFR